MLGATSNGAGNRGSSVPTTFGGFANSPISGSGSGFSFRWPPPPGMGGGSGLASSGPTPGGLIASGQMTPTDLTPRAPTPMRFAAMQQASGSAAGTPRIRGKRSIWNDYDRKKTLGTGAYGRVYLALDKRSGAHVAIKRTVMPTEDGAFLNPTTLREITILKKLRGHPNIVGFIDCRVPDLSDAEGGGSYTTGDSFSMMNNSPMTYTPPSSSASFGQPDSADKRAVWLIMEYVETDLGRFMKNPAKEWVKGGVPKGLPIDMVKSFLFQILCGIAYCHANLVLHRDLKPCNILVTDQGKIKITDFGLGRTYNVPMPPYSPGVVTLMYRAPEICLSLQTYTPAVDVWSAGCIFAEMLTGRILFNGNHAQASNDFDLLITIFRVLGVPTEDVWPGLDELIPGDAEQGYARTFLLSQRRANYTPRGLAKCVAASNLSEDGLDLLTRLLIYNPSKRLTAQAALKHPFLRGVSEVLYSAEEREWLLKNMDLVV